MSTAVESKDTDFCVSNYEIENMYRSHGEHWFLNHLLDKLVGNGSSPSISYWENNKDFKVSRGFIISMSWIIVTFLFSNLKFHALFTNKNNLQLVTVAKHWFWDLLMLRVGSSLQRTVGLFVYLESKWKSFSSYRHWNTSLKGMYRLNVKVPWVARKI